jgi:rhamnulokinase
VGQHIPVIHIVGGGSRNRLLNQLTADATGRRVLAGPAEATAIGNALTQALGAGDIGSLEELRALVRHSFEVEEFTPSGQTLPLP